MYQDFFQNINSHLMYLSNFIFKDLLDVELHPIMVSFLRNFSTSKLPDLLTSKL